MQIRCPRVIELLRLLAGGPRRPAGTGFPPWQLPGDPALPQEEARALRRPLPGPLWW